MIKNKILFLFLFMISVGALTARDASAWSCSSPPDPRSDSSGYASWCDQCANGGSVYNNSSGYGCTPGTGSSSSKGSSGSGGYSQPSVDWGAVQRREREETNRKIQEQRRRRRAEKRRLDQEKKRDQQRLEEETQRIFDKNKNEAMHSLKGVSEASFKFKRATGDQWKLKGDKEKESTFELKSLSQASGGVAQGEIHRTWKQLHCGASISSSAMKAANPSDGSAVNFEEVKFLGEQAINALVGEALRVQCPEVKSPPKPYGQIQLSDSAPLVLFYKALHKDTQQQVRNIEEAKADVKKYGKAKREKQIEAYQLEKKIARIRGEKEIQAKEPVQVSQVELKPNEKSEESNEGDALAIALAALKKAKEAEADVAAAMESAMERRSQAQRKLNRNEQLFNKIEKDPDKAQEMLNDFNSGKKPGS